MVRGKGGDLALRVHHNKLAAVPQGIAYDRAGRFAPSRWRNGYEMSIAGIGDELASMTLPFDFLPKSN